jgi:hypothetical protein
MAWARDSIPPAIYTFLALNTLAVGLRVYVRTCMSKSFGYDDYAMVVAFVSAPKNNNDNNSSEKVGGQIS